MAKFKLNKPSKRQPARQRYKIQKKIRQHNKKQRREAKKNPKKSKQAVVQVPNICPFKGDILKEIEVMKKQKEEEKQRQKLEREKMKQDEKKNVINKGLEGLISNAEMRGKLHENFTPIENKKTQTTNKEKSLKAYYKEFKKVIEAADIILEIVDARDPLGTRCVQVEQAIKDLKSNKRLVLVLNKADLVPRNILDKWLKYLKRTAPTIPFKASTQDQSKKLGQRKFSKADKGMQGSSSVGTEILMSLLANYCRNKGVKTSIRVGVVGLPNVGKSSIINSLKRSRACNVGATPGVTRAMQEVQLDSKIKLLDSPGIVFAPGSDSIACLRNSVQISTLADPITPANAILQRVTKQQMMEMYDILEYQTPEEFYNLKAARMGRFKKGGVPDVNAAARHLLEDWNSGKIKYYTLPPEDNENISHVSSEIVSEIAKEFDLNNFDAMECEMLNKVGKNCDESFAVIESQAEEKMDEDKNDEELLSKRIAVDISKKIKIKSDDSEDKKVDLEMTLDGNKKLNQIKEMQFKKEMKQRKKRDKVAQILSTGLENFSFENENENKKNDEDYDFNVDFDVKEIL